MIGCKRIHLKITRQRLQVEGRENVHKLALGVTASADVIEQAVVWGADALLVHHGYFWKSESAIDWIKGRRIGHCRIKCR